MSDQFPIYFEQQSGSLCGRHAINSLLQGPYTTEVDLSEIARELDDAERALMMSAGTDTADALRYLGEESFNVDDSGNFSVTVCRTCLRSIHRRIGTTILLPCRFCARPSAARMAFRSTATLPWSLPHSKTRSATRAFCSTLNRCFAAPRVCFLLRSAPADPGIAALVCHQKVAHPVRSPLVQSKLAPAIADRPRRFLRVSFPC